MRPSIRRRLLLLQRMKSRLGFLKTSAVRELRFQFCQSSATGQNLRYMIIYLFIYLFVYLFIVIRASFSRSFLQNSYVDLKQAHPRLPVLVRESAGVEPRFVARFGLHLHLYFTAKESFFFRLQTEGVKQLFQLLDFQKSRSAQN